MSLNPAPLLKWMVERENIRLKRERGEPWPWSDDQIFREFKFTNVRRFYDRTTQIFYRLYQDGLAKMGGDAPKATVLMNCATMRYFGTPEWAALMGWQNEFDAERVLKVARDAKRDKIRIFTPAYTLTNAGLKMPKEECLVAFLTALNARASSIVTTLVNTRSWELGGKEMMKVMGFGGSGFMTKEILQDFLLVCPKVCLDAESWTPVGPGARKGLNILANRAEKFTQPEASWLAEIRELREVGNREWVQRFPKGGLLTAHDVQFCCCELQKYVRAGQGGHMRARYYPPHEREAHEINGIEVF